MNKIGELFNEWKNTDEIKERKLSDITMKNYDRVVKNISFGILGGQPPIIQKLRDNYENENTRASYLNMIILLRKYKDLDVDKLIKYRSIIKSSIELLRKKDLLKNKEELPTQEYLDSQLEHLEGIKYIINYLFIEYSFRNKDINFKFISKLPDDTENNYLIVKPRFIMIIINDYKTKKQYGQKVYRITNKKFRKEILKLKRIDGEYMIGNNNGGKYSISNFNDIILKYTIDKLGETKMFKIKMKLLIDNKDFKTMEFLSKSRGTSLKTIMSNYNVYNNE